MQKDDLNRLNSIFTNYKLAHRFFGVDDVQIGGGNNLTLYKRYYFYIPVSIGLAIVTVALIFKVFPISIQNFKHLLIEKVFLEDIHSVCFKIVDNENISYVFLTLYSEDPNALYADCDFLKNFIQRKIKNNIL